MQVAVTGCVCALALCKRKHQAHKGRLRLHVRHIHSMLVSLSSTADAKMCKALQRFMLLTLLVHSRLICFYMAALPFYA